MSDKDPAMKNITEVDSGFMVRKHVNGKRHQLFFGNAAYGSRDQALAAAMRARDELVSSLEEKRVLPTYNYHNPTGLTGISWHCKANPHRNGNISHQLRVQAPNTAGGKAFKTSFSVKEHGLWKAYLNAVVWRIEHTFSLLEEAPNTARSFRHFMTHYLNTLTHSAPGPHRDELNLRLSALLADTTTPKTIRIMVIELLVAERRYAA